MAEAEQTHADMAACERALDELLTGIALYDEDHAAQARRHLLRMKADPTIEISTAPDIPDRLAFYGMVTDPIRRAMVEATRKLGHRLYHLVGGTDALMESLDRVACMDPDRLIWRRRLLNEAWNGLGSGEDRWWSQ